MATGPTGGPDWPRGDERGGCGGPWKPDVSREQLALQTSLGNTPGGFPETCPKAKGGILLLLSLLL